MHLVMGVTGKVGGATARHLLKQGKPRIYKDFPKVAGRNIHLAKVLFPSTCKSSSAADGCANQRFRNHPK